RLAKKVAAGADFVQTQAVYDIPRFTEAMRRVVDLGLTERVAILPGIILPRSAAMLRYMNASVPGVRVPEALIQRMSSASDPKEEGFKIAVELIHAVRQIPGVKGVHLQAIEAEHLLPQLAERAGLLPRP
ncbi:MAG: methylenetetrahydrofolate reductase, partial [Tepidisphaeraceae bacterium]